MVEPGERGLGHGVVTGPRERLLDHPPRALEVAQAVLVHLGELLPRARIEAGPAGHGLPEPPRLVPARAPLLAPREVEQEALAGRAREPPLEGEVIARGRPPGVGRLQQA